MGHEVSASTVVNLVFVMTCVLLRARTFVAFLCCSVSGHRDGLASHKSMVWFYIESRSPVFVFEMFPLTR